MTAKIVDFDEENKKISLSIKALLPDTDEDAAEAAEDSAADAEEAAPTEE